MARTSRRRRSNLVPILFVELLLLVVLGAILWVKFTPQGQQAWAEFRGGQDLYAEQGGGAKADKERVEAEHQAAEELRKLETIVIAEKIHPDYPEKRVTSLSFRQEEIDDVALEQIAKLFRIESLVLAGTNLSDEQLRYLSGMRSVTNLGLGLTPITDAGLVHIEGLTNVNALHISETNISDAGLPHIAKMSELKILDLSDTKVTDRGLKHLMPLVELDWLLLINDDITDAGLQQLEQMKGLKRLTIYGTRVTPQGMSRIRRALPSLTIDYGSSKEAGQPKGGPLPAVTLSKSDDVGQTGPNQKTEALKDLVEPENVLKEIFGDTRAPGEKIHREGLFSGMLDAHAEGQETPPQALEHRAHATPMSKRVEAEQQAAEQLRKLGVIVIAERLSAAHPEKQVTSVNFRQKEIDDAALEHIAKLFRLQSLDLAGTNLSDEHLRHLSGMQSLSNLILGSTPITDAGLAHIEGLTNMAALHLTNTGVSDAGLPRLAKMSELKILDLSNTKVTDHGLKHLAPLQELDWLLLNNNDITDAGLHQLERMKGLKRLTIGGTNVTPQGMSRIKRALPKLHVDYASSDRAKQPRGEIDRPPGKPIHRKLPKDKDAAPAVQEEEMGTLKDLIQPENALKEIFGNGPAPKKGP